MSPATRAAVTLAAFVNGAAPAQASGFGPREGLARQGVELSLVVQGDSSANLTGGLRQGTALRVPVQAALDLDLGRLVGWRGSRLHAGVQAFEGRNAGERLVGDLHGFDNVDSQRLRQVSEVWLEQSLLRDRLRLKLGKADANADFARVLASGEFLNSAAGYSPTIQGFPSYPDPAVGVSLFASPTGWLSVGMVVFDGATHEGCHGRTGNRALGTLFGAPDALFAAASAPDPGGTPGRSRAKPARRDAAPPASTPCSSSACCRKRATKARDSTSSPSSGPPTPGGARSRTSWA